MASITDELPLQTTEHLLRRCLAGHDGPARARAGALAPDAPHGQPKPMALDLPALASAFGRRLRDAGMTVTPAQSAQCALSLDLVKPDSRHGLYWTTRAVFVTAPRELVTFDRVFADIFGSALASP
jgi:uncharacterized protein with von Willebrand factor type A (vWA) domain